MEISDSVNRISYNIIGACMTVHSGVGPGFPEEYYQKALEHEFTLQNIDFQPQKDIIVCYKDVQIGLNYLDFVIEETVILEIKSVRTLDDIHKAQVIRYLAATDYPLALLVNFGRPSLEQQRILPPKKIQEFKKNNSR